jgi:hypothetical protein
MGLHLICFIDISIPGLKLKSLLKAPKLCNNNRYFSNNRDQTGTYCGLSLAPFFVEQLPRLEVLHLDGVTNVVVGGLAIAQQLSAKQGKYSVQQSQMEVFHLKL